MSQVTVQQGSQPSVQQSSHLTGLLVPLADRTLLLPNVAIAELIGWQHGDPSSDSPPWHLRQITWRDRELPLISFEAACGSPVVIGERARIVVAELDHAAHYLFCRPPA